LSCELDSIVIGDIPLVDLVINAGSVIGNLLSRAIKHLNHLLKATVNNLYTGVRTLSDSMNVS
jgi:hypothetical protein